VLVVIHFNPFLRLGWGNYHSSVMFRNHRKILVLDNHIGFCGGMNIAEDYCSAAIGGNGRFRDTHLKVVGPAVQSLLNVSQNSFAEAIHEYPSVIPNIMRTAPTVVKTMMGNALTRYASYKNGNNNNNNDVKTKFEELGPLDPGHLSIESNKQKMHNKINQPTSFFAILSAKLLNKVIDLFGDWFVTRRLQSRAALPTSASLSNSPTAIPQPLPEHILLPPMTSSNVFVQVLASNVYRNQLAIQRAMR
jgi:phosphatidylserine/phosphatidylglycerophosphate/cardiolipin synthase-like enzyme